MWPGLVLRAFTENALSKKPITINGDGRAKRRFINVKDLAQGHVLALDPKADNQIYNLEGDKDVTIKELADLVSLNIENVKVEYIVDKKGVKSYIDWFKNNNK